MSKARTNERASNCGVSRRKFSLAVIFCKISVNGECSSSVMVQESTWRKEAIAAKVGKRSYFHCQPITACVDVRRASLKISLKSDPVHLKLHPPVSLIAPVELYMKPKIFPAPGGGLGYNSTGAITGVKRYFFFCQK